MPVPVDRYVASMVLGGVGDAMGFKCGSWEFCFNGKAIYEEAVSLGGVEKLEIKLPKFMVSDDTVMCLATAEALVAQPDDVSEKLFCAMAQSYKDCMKDMNGRSAGMCTTNAMHHLKPLRKDGFVIPFNPKAGGCGAAMRATPIGLRFARPEQLDDLIAVSVESGRMTHNHPTGFLGAVAAALFTAYAVQNRPVQSWGAGLMETLPKCLEYVRRVGRDVKENEGNWNYFSVHWYAYLKTRGIRDGQSSPQFPKKFGFKERDAFYKSLSYSGWGGSSGHDAPMIAYDALLGCGGDWIELCKRGMLHGGDNDSTGILAGAWFGVLYGLDSVPQCHQKAVEYRDRLASMGAALHALQTGGAGDAPQPDGAAGLPPVPDTE